LWLLAASKKTRRPVRSSAIAANSKKKRTNLLVSFFLQQLSGQFRLISLVDFGQLKQRIKKAYKQWKNFKIMKKTDQSQVGTAEKIGG
jgi:hypothetical protein